MTRLLLALALGLLGLTLAIIPAFAAEPAKSVDEVLDRLKTTYADVPSVEADFVQTSTGMSYPQPLVQRGTVALERPGSMRWVFVEPTEQQYLSDGSTLWVVNEADKTCTIFRQLDETLARYFDFMTGMADVRDNFVTTLGEAVEGRDVLVLKPKQAESTIGTIHIQVDRETGLVAGFLVVSPFGDRTDVQLTNVRTGRDIPDADFSWAAREGFREIEG